MAFTVTKEQILANKREVTMTVVADGAEANISTGLSKITGISYMPSSMATANIHLYVNKDSSATSSLGILGVSGCAAGDQFYVVAIGV